MNFTKRVIFLLIVCLSISTISFAQTDDVDFDQQNTEELAEEEWEDDDEIQVVDVESVENQNIVDQVYAYVDVVQDISQQEEGVVSWALYSDVSGFVAYAPNKERDIFLLKRYDVIKGYDEEESKNYIYIKEYIFNKNQAWDFIYERIYDNEGKLKYFVRRYNTYNSGCAEVAFEESEYFYNPNGDLVKKTYQIYDSQNNPLDIDNCYMDREVYDKYMLLQDFLRTNPLPLEE
ncbi:MAG: hypothetical protein SPL98_02245 [Bacteroidales bacterium]|nr:hypothetical protein [Bacteroidales bacterium]MDY6393708.1 hypothetical protein [Bacteroidales bacterium]MDY6395507.1 hypothetical protein [Bacteroidales bacterium]MDY6402802.1 hypothetical protein [Bacteroidales bacterium]